MPSRATRLMARPDLVTLLFALTYAAAVWVGRSTIPPGESIALEWPAAGVAVAWLVVQPRRHLPIDVAGLAVTLLVVSALTGADLETLPSLLVGNVGETLLVTMLLRRYAPELWGCGGQSTLLHGNLFAAMIGSAVVGSFVGAGVATASLWLLEGAGPPLLDLVGWWGADLTGIVVFFTAVHLALHRLLQLGRPSTRVESVAGRAEQAVVLVATAALYAVFFGSDQGLFVFPLLSVTVWAGLRCSTVFVAWHSFLCGVFVIAATTRGVGPIAVVENPRAAAVAAQLFVLMVLVTGIALSTSRGEREAALHRAEGARKEAADQADALLAVLESMRDGVMIIEEPARVVFENDASRRMRPAEAMTAADARDVPVVRLDGSPVPFHERPVARALRGEAVTGVDLMMNADGVEQVLSVSALPLPQASGPARALSVYHDVTAERAHLAELDAFAGVVAHDLKNPITVVEGWLEALGDIHRAAQRPGAEPADPAEVLAIVSRVEGATSRMRHLINDLLARAAAGDRPLELERLDIAAIAADQAAEVQAADLLRVDGEVPTVSGDEVLVRQLLDNLIGNAVKYVAPGVVPQLMLSGELDGPMVRLRLTDNGIGVPVEDAERIFEQFHRAHPEVYTGTGLGLSICRRIVERHGGRIGVRPARGGGSVFEITLPSAAPLTPRSPADLPGQSDLDVIA